MSDNINPTSAVDNAESHQSTTSRGRSTFEVQVSEEVEAIRVGYEYKIARLESRITQLTEEFANVKTELKASDQRGTAYETEIADLRKTINNMTPSYKVGTAVQLTRWEDAKERLWSKENGRKENYIRDPTVYNNGNVAAHGANILADVALLESKTLTSLASGHQAMSIFEEYFDETWCPYWKYTLEELQKLSASIITAINCGGTIIAEKIPPENEGARKTRSTAFQTIQILFKKHEKHAEAQPGNDFDNNSDVVKLLQRIVACKQEIVAACWPHNKGKMVVLGKVLSYLFWVVIDVGFLIQTLPTRWFCLHRTTWRNLRMAHEKFG